MTQHINPAIHPELLTVSVRESKVDLVIVEIDNLLLQLILDAAQKVVERHVSLRDANELVSPDKATELH